MTKSVVLFLYLFYNFVTADIIADWQQEIEESLKRNIIFATWRYADENKTEQIASPDEFIVRRLYPSKFDVKSFHQIPSTLTTANEGLGITAQKRGYSYEKWGSEKKLRWEIPSNHPGQDRKNCINMTLLASTGNIYSFYDSFRKIERASYVLYTTQGFIHPSGAVGNNKGYYMGQEACENRWDYAKKWYINCKNGMKKHSAQWIDLFSNQTSPELYQKLINECTDFSNLGIPTLSSGATASSSSSSFDVKKYEKVFVIPALWDFNYHHFLADSLARIVYYYRYLKKHHPNIMIHIRSFEDYNKEYKGKYEKQMKAKLMRKALFDLLGISSSRIISGPILAQTVIIPRCLRCSYALSNPIEIRALSKILLFFTKRYFKQYPSLLPNITALSITSPPVMMTTSISPSSKKKSPVMVILQRDHGNNDRIWNDTEYQTVLTSFIQAYPNHYIIPISSKHQGTNHYCLACDIYIYSQADCLVGIHGAGLSNMMFMPSDGLIVEIVTTLDDVNMPVCGYCGPYSAIFGHHHYIDAFYSEGGERLNATRVAQQSSQFYSFLHNYTTTSQRKPHVIEIYYNSSSTYRL